jgi:hypothetical protein
VKLIYTLLILAAFANAQPPEPDDASKKKIVDEARVKALAYFKELPVFSATQLTRRNVDAKGTNQWKTLDTINEQVTVKGAKEERHVVAVNGKKVSSEPKDVPLTAADFGNLIVWTFDPKSEAEISWSQWDTLRGHRVHLLGYRVKKEHSQFTVGKGKNEVTAGYFGVVAVDAESGSILKVGLVATDIPAKFSTQNVSMELHYEFAKIGDHFYVLPLKAEAHAKEGKSSMWNEVEYRDFRKPGAESASSK